MEAPVEKTLKKVPIEATFEPVRIAQPEAWQWEVLAEAFLPDPAMKFWLGEKMGLAALRDFFEAVIKDTLVSGGAVFASPDQKAVLIYTRLSYSVEPPSEWKQRWYQVLEPAGVERYYWLYEQGDLDLDPAKFNITMMPDYMGVSQQVQGQGYGSRLFKWTFNHFHALGYEMPCIAASSRRSAKLYELLLDYRFHKELFLKEGDLEPFVVFIKRPTTVK